MYNGKKKKSRVKIVNPVINIFLKNHIVVILYSKVPPEYFNYLVILFKKKGEKKTLAWHLILHAFLFIV